LTTYSKEIFREGFYCQHDLSFDVSINEKLFFCCNNLISKLILKKFNLINKRVEMYKGHKGSIYSTTCSSTFLNRVYSGCYSNIFIIHNLFSSKRIHRETFQQRGGISGIITFRKERYAFLGFASSRVVLFNLEKKTIVKDFKISASVYTIDLTADQLFIGGSTKKFYSMKMKEINEFIDSEETKQKN
jgi:hypothetical protein